MHFPPYYKRKDWQRFILGAAFGGLIAYCILIFMYGSFYEQLLEENYQLQAEITDLRNQNEALLKDSETLDDIQKQNQTVQKIDIHIRNAESLNIDRLTIPIIEDRIKQTIDHIIGQDIHIVSESDRLMINVIESQTFPINEFDYHFEVKKLVLSRTVKIDLEGKRAR